MALCKYLTALRVSGSDSVVVLMPQCWYYCRRGVVVSDMRGKNVGIVYNVIRERFFFGPKRFLTNAAKVDIGSVPEKQESLNITDLPSCTHGILISLRLEANADMVLKCEAAGLI